MANRHATSSNSSRTAVPARSLPRYPGRASLRHVAGLADVLDLVEAALIPGGVLVVVEWARERLVMLDAGTAVDGSAATAAMLGSAQSESWSRFIPFSQVHLASAAFGALVGPVEPNASARIALRRATPVLTVFDQTPGVNHARTILRVSLMASRCRYECGIPALLLDASLLLFACPSALPAPPSESQWSLPPSSRSPLGRALFCRRCRRRVFVPRSWYSPKRPGI